MPLKLRIATFNLENLDDTPGQEPTLNKRIALMRPQLLRFRWDAMYRGIAPQERLGQHQLQPARCMCARRYCPCRYAPLGARDRWHGS